MPLQRISHGHQAKVRLSIRVFLQVAGDSLAERAEVVAKNRAAGDIALEVFNRDLDQPLDFLLSRFSSWSAASAYQAQFG